MRLTVKNLRVLLESCLSEDDDGTLNSYEAAVEEDLEGRYVEFNGMSYHSDDLPYPGTFVDVIDNSVGFYSDNSITIEWSDDTPSGTSRLTLTSG